MATPTQLWGYRSPHTNLDAWGVLRAAHTGAADSSTKLDQVLAQQAEILRRIEHLHAVTETLRRYVMN